MSTKTCRCGKTPFLDVLIRYQNNKLIFKAYCYCCECGCSSGFKDSEQEAADTFWPKPPVILAEYEHN